MNGRNTPKLFINTIITSVKDVIRKATWKFIICAIISQKEI